MAFPEDLPPAGLELTTKLLIYFGILYFFSTAITTWLVARRRQYPKEQQTAPVRTASSSQPSMTVGPLSFDDSRDVLSGLKVQIEGAEAALNKLKASKDRGEISDYAYGELQKQYTTQVNQLTEKMNEILKRDIQSTTGEVVEGISDDEIDQLEADLEKQLEDLEKEDSFLRPRPKRGLDEVLEEKTTPVQQPESTTPSQAAPASSPQSMVPPPPKSTGQARSSPTAIPPPPPKSTPTAQPPVSTPEKKVEMPPPPKSQVAAPPKPSQSQQTQPSTTPQPVVPAPPPPKTQQSDAPSPAQPNIAAEQPMKVSADEEGMFAKSTSIAALRMDMLRELARLKKLINEDQE